MVLTIAAIGVSGSGKTTTLEYLISELSNEGYKVGAIKHIHREGFTIDKEGTNTWRFSKAGSKITVAISPEEIAIMEKTNHALKDFDKIVRYLENENLDVVFVEGFHDFISKRPEILKIITAKDLIDLEKTLEESVPPVLAITGLIAKEKQPPNKIPMINLPNEANKLLTMVKTHLEATKHSKQQEN